MSVKGPQSRDRIIGARLRAIRKERTTLSLEAAAAVAQWSPSRLSRTENGIRHVTTEEVATLLTAYKLPVNEREEVMAQVQAGSSSGWWDRPLPGVPPETGALASYEANANELVDVAMAVVPGLLHTYETAKAIMAADAVPPQDIETRWMARLRRQQILGTLDYTAFVGETALRTPYGGEGALRGQLEHLLRAQQRGMTVRVVPERQAQVLLLHAWLWMRFPNARPVVHVELNSGAFFLHDEDVDPYTSVLERLDRIALSQDFSRKLMTNLLEGT
jgi:transcriptional regulator with XRE-family HTH domain